MLSLDDFANIEDHEALVLPILRVDDPEGCILKEPSRKVTAEEMRSLTMKNFLYALSYTTGSLVGVGLAAPQLGLPLQIFMVQDNLRNIYGPLPEGVAEERGRWQLAPEFFINPKIVYESKDPDLTLYFESCMSVPDKMYAVIRPIEIAIETTSPETFQREIIRLAGWAARVAQHEDDHLRGITVVDRALPGSEITPEEYDAKWRHATQEEIAERFLPKLRRFFRKKK